MLSRIRFIFEERTSGCRGLVPCIPGVLAFLLMLSSCAKTPQPELVPEGAIGFYSSSLTKAIIDGDDASTDNTIAKDAARTGRGFGVIGYRKLGGWSETFNNVKVSPVTTGSPAVALDPPEWQYSPIQMWEYCPYRFFAYYPHDPSATLATGDCLAADESKMAFAVTYTVPNTWPVSYQDDQTDFLIAKPKAVPVADNGKVVLLDFMHALCQVGFKICKSSDAGSLQVVDIQLLRLNSTSKATISATAGVYGIAWTDKKNPLNYSYSSVAAGLSIPYCPPSPEDPAYLSVPSMLLVPQKFNTNNVVKLTLRDASDGRTWTLQGKIEQPTVKEWLPGKRYIYTLTVGADPTILDMSMEIADWTDVNINITM